MPYTAARPHSRRLEHPLYAAIGIALALLAGCTRPPAAGPNAVGPGAAGPGAAPVLLATADVRLPLDAYLPSIAETNRLAQASRALLRRCMAEFGVDYDVVAPAPVGPRTWNERRYGLTDAAQVGYWPRDRAAPTRPRHRAQSAAVAALVTGTGAATVNHRRVPTGGCAAEAYRRLTAHDPPGADRYLAQRLGSDSFFASRQDPAVRAATLAWSRCLHAAGYDYATPLDPPRDTRFQGPTATPLEISTARADVACKRQTNLAGIWYAAESARQTALVAANHTSLRRGRDAYDAELAVAAGV
jgi:hypothetical protein